MKPTSATDPHQSTGASHGWRAVVLSDPGVLLLALAKLGLHLLTNGQYVFHRDELEMLDDARYLAWGYVSNPPLASFMARVAAVYR